MREWFSIERKLEINRTKQAKGTIEPLLIWIQRRNLPYQDVSMCLVGILYLAFNIDVVVVVCSKEPIARATQTASQKNRSHRS